LVVSDEGITVALDTKLTPELINEGLAREFVNRIQNLRKNSNLEVTDRITVSYNAPDNVVNAIESLSSYVKNETLANEIFCKEELNGEEFIIDEVKILVKIEKV
jgi:isoleucyl-tRNA synthetase